MLGVGSIPAIIGGFIFGKWWGTIILILGNTIGATLFYFLAKTLIVQVLPMPDPNLVPMPSSIKNLPGDFDTQLLSYILLKNNVEYTCGVLPKYVT